MSYIHENLKKIRVAAGLSQAEFAALIEVKRPTYATYESGVMPKGNAINMISAVTGIYTNMLLNTPINHLVIQDAIDNILEYKKSGSIKTKSDKAIINADLILNEPVEEYAATNLTKTKVIDKHLDQNIIPVFPAGGSASHTELYNDLGNKPEGFIRVPGYEDCDFATYAYGHSMYPVIESGCLILCRKTQGKQMILWGEIYYIITQDYRLIKRLQKGTSKTTVMAISENDEKRRDGDRKYEGIEIELDDIKELYLVKGIIKKIQI